MYYTKLSFLLLILLLGGCISVPPRESSPPTIEEENKSNQQPLVERFLTRYQIAITELNNNNLEEAKKYFLELMETQPEFSGPRANLALIYIKQRRYDKAEENIRLALEKNPNMAQALNIAGVIENRKGNINKAKKYYEKAISKKEDYALAHYNLALLYDVYLQNIRKAVDHYQRYLLLIDYEDKRTKVWVEELKRNITSDI